MSSKSSATPARLQNFADFYRTEYGQVITALRPVGRVRATLLEADQPAGDWSDAATPELIIGQQLSGPSSHTANLGAGRFRGVGAQHDFIVTPPGFASSIVIDAPHRIRCLAIPWKQMCTWADSDPLRLPAGGDFGHLHYGVHRDRRLNLAIDALWRQDDGASAAASLFSDALLVEVLAILVDLSNPARTQPVAGLTRGDLLRVDACMRARLAEDIGLADLAALTSLSVAHFCRAFKRSTGRSPYQALIQLRMERAQHLLGTTSLTVAEIALACGYSQPAHFAKLFRRTTGAAPSDWRRRRSL